jgi:hypothetical protein
MKHVLALVLALTACATTATGPTPPRVALTTAEACAKADLSMIVTSAGEALKFYIDDLINSSPTSLEADLSAVAKQVGRDAVVCAILAYESTFAKTNLVGPPPGLARARVWVGGTR